MALLEQRCRSAAQAFTELLSGLDPQKIQVRSRPLLAHKTAAVQVDVDDNHRLSPRPAEMAGLTQVVRRGRTAVQLSGLHSVLTPGWDSPCSLGGGGYSSWLFLSLNY